MQNRHCGELRTIYFIPHTEEWITSGYTSNKAFYTLLQLLTCCLLPKIGWSKPESSWRSVIPTFCWSASKASWDLLKCPVERSFCALCDLKFGGWYPTKWQWLFLPSPEQISPKQCQPHNIENKIDIWEKIIQLQMGHNRNLLLTLTLNEK